MFPSLHPQVVEAVGEGICPDWEGNAVQAGQYTNEYNTNVSGRFRCSNPACSKSWASGRVAIRITAFKGHRYSAMVYNQHCKACNNLGIMKLDEVHYVERVSYRLKKWAGIPQELPPYREKAGPPHMAHLCEGCIQGHCRQGNRDDILAGFQNLSLD
ncbi:hypothetical protein PpBr36_06925 [Pyricularia pennisetigena]|uniref:hypothetical protein n=1 Tax=Pyricularia pennisetigena TaxID=1578925 RepID=UPI0011535903|nr:hypothetical protein PpBr36_06925 [Pyricularia pennisetigena]TLS24976.1 hypothetical protein PpBr36_06925 [Pyricularia pennisetigena]